MSRIEKLLRKELRNIQFPEKGEVFLIDTGTVEHHVLKELLTSIFKDRLTITSRTPTTRKRKNVFRPSSLENELCRELKSFLEDEETKQRWQPLLATVPESLIKEYAEKHGFKGAFLAPQDDVRAFIATLQEKQQQTKSALRKSFEWLARASETRSEGLRRVKNKGRKE